MRDPDPELVRLLRGGSRILVFTGAGISTGSGIDDYRGPQGVWTRRQPVYYQDFMRSGEARVEYWEQRVESWPQFRDAAPNAAHEAMVKLERAGKVLLVATQNIDGLHARAGTSPALLAELHGTTLEVECTACGARSDPQEHMDAFAETREPPQCSRCGGYLKSATISFGQSLRPEVLDRAFAAARSADLVLALGSTLSVHPAAAIPLLAVENRAPYVIINRGPTDHDEVAGVTLRLEGDVVEILPPAVDAALA